MEAIQKTFIPGTEWVYFKIYMGIKSSDSIISNELFSIIKYLEHKGLIKKWFFIRYNDPHHHIRVRLLVNNPEEIGKIICLFSKQFAKPIQNKLVWNIQLDTYQRELERYGNHLIEYAESFFHINSKYIQDIIRKISARKEENYRWMIALRMIDVFLSDFKFSLEIKHSLLDSLSRSFKSEFGFNEHNARVFNSKFRNNKKTIEAILHNTLNDDFFNELSVILKQHSQETFKIVVLLHAAMKKNSSGKNVYDLVFSYIHMMLNRLFLTENRKCELIIYDYMRRYYASELAKVKYQSLAQ